VQAGTLHIALREEKTMEIKKICVLGAGLIGSGIAQVSAEAGYKVSIMSTYKENGTNRAIGK
jgi:3-hydroxyacyl-CoA dehydrogenase